MAPLSPSTTVPGDVRPAAPTTGPVVSARGVGKVFRLPHDRHSTVRDQLLHPLRRSPPEIMHALRDVSFDVQPGEFLAVVGKNGSGKSTLLRCMAGIYPVDTGHLGVRGRVAPFIELGVGFNEELAARDNLVTNGVLLGLSARQIRDRYEDILRFADLGEFADLKLKNYSSGMAVRLGFSLTTHIAADVLLFDEVIAVGDLAFKRKCFRRFEELRAAGHTLVLVSHDMDTVRDLCDRALLLDRGELVCDGEPEMVADRYESLNLGEGAPASRGQTSPPPSPRPAPGNDKQKPSPLRPPAVIGRRRIAVIATRLAAVTFKLKYLDAGLGYAWAVMRPLLVFAVLYAVFTTVGQFDQGVDHYALYLLTALVLWTFFFDATMTGVFCLVRQAGILRKLPVPPYAIPLSVALRSLFDLGMNLVAVFILVAIVGVSPRLDWLELIPLIGLVTVFAFAVIMLASALYVRFRDVDQIWQVGSQMLFYGSGIFFVVTALPGDLPSLMVQLNPLSFVFTEMRHALIDPTAPSAAEVAGGGEHVLVTLTLVATLLAIGLVVFRRMAPRAAENL